MINYQVCTNGIWDSSVPGIYFDKDGVSNYAKMFKQMEELYPRGEIGLKLWEAMVEKMKKQGRQGKYDCIVGVSGGTDSSYLLYIVNKYGLRPLAVNLDNGWNRDISLKNIKKVTSQLNVDLETYVIRYEEIRDLLCSYMKASLPWIDAPTDLAIKAVLYKIAGKENIKFILRGNDFRSEGFQPREWTYSDYKQLKYILRKFGSVKLKTFPSYSLPNLFYFGGIKGIKSIYPFYFIDYKKSVAKKFLIDQFGWEDYGGHHYENHFTRFALGYWLPKKFNIDKRIISLSAQVLSGDISRDEAINQLKTPSIDPEKAEYDITYVFKKLDISDNDFRFMMNSDNKYYYDYPSNYPFFRRNYKCISRFSKVILPYKPISFVQMEMRAK